MIGGSFILILACCKPSNYLNYFYFNLDEINCRALTSTVCLKDLML